jgi:hypothetical protein
MLHEQRIRTLFCRHVYALWHIRCCDFHFNPLNAELNPICHLLALLGAHHIFHVSGLRVKTDAEIIQPYFSFTLHFIKDYIFIIFSNLYSNDSFAMSSAVINTCYNLCFSVRPCSVRLCLLHTS